MPHQANLRTTYSAIKKLGVEKEKVYVNIKNTGNISSACILVCLAKLFLKGALKENSRVLIIGFGAGMIYGAMVFTI